LPTFSHFYRVELIFLRNFFPILVAPPCCLQPTNTSHTDRGSPFFFFQLPSWSLPEIFFSPVCFRGGFRRPSPPVPSLSHCTSLCLFVFPRSEVPRTLATSFPPLPSSRKPHLFLPFSHHSLPHSFNPLSARKFPS